MKMLIGLIKGEYWTALLLPLDMSANTQHDFSIMMKQPQRSENDTTPRSTTSKLSKR
ncbi:hypothetical protein GPUN_0003 [Glaciecola punicea ACAM 611]|uniref:Uncharacterized protein n=1 Tax=Glaciecola punicea ACAM 611 TaxID=1121923 RepID=H5T780_9ALTE|nr:hypothetical protein GPUN_0003 [Glaciecola punicea ACAM 611]